MGDFMDTLGTAAVMVAEILNLAIHMAINHLEQKVGKIEVTETLLKILNMKVGEAGEKGEFQVMIICQTRRINNPFLQAYKLI